MINLFIDLIKPNINKIIFTIYLSVVWIIYIFLKICDMSAGGINRKVFGVISIVILLIIYFVASLILKAVGSISISKNTEKSKKQKWIFFIINTVAAFLVFLFCFFAFKPGGISNDILNQYKQAITGHYSDWHPVLHTFVFYTIPIKLFGSIEAAIIIQCIYFSLVVGFMGETIYEYLGLKASFITNLYVLSNPYVGSIAVYLWKDVAFAATGCLIMTLEARLYYSGNKQKKNYVLDLLLGILLACETLFRHNGILFTVPLIVALFLVCSPKKYIRIVISAVVFFILIKYGLYSALNVEKPGSRKIETLGLPINIIASAVKDNPDILDKEVVDFAHSIAPQEKWVNEYVIGDFNSIKWAGVNLDIIEESSVKDILEYAIICIKENPKASLRGVFKLTNTVYMTDGYPPNIGYDNIGIANNEYGFEYKGISTWAEIWRIYNSVYSETLLKYIKYIGFSLLLILCVGLSKCDLKTLNDWKKILLVLPVFVYSFGTMLLLTSSGDSRFFFIDFVVCPVCILILMLENKSNSQGGDTINAE